MAIQQWRHSITALAMAAPQWRHGNGSMARAEQWQHRNGSTTTASWLEQHGESCMARAERQCHHGNDSMLRSTWREQHGESRTAMAAWQWQQGTTTANDQCDKREYGIDKSKGNAALATWQQYSKGGVNNGNGNASNETCKHTTMVIRQWQYGICKRH